MPVFMIWSKECNAGRVHHCGEADDDGNFSLCMFTRESTESDRDWPWCCSSSGIHGSKDKMESPLSSDPFTTRHQSVQFRLDTMIFFMALLIGSTAGSFAFCAQSVSRRHGRCSMHEEFEMLRWYTVRLHERKLASERYGGPKLCHGNQGTLSISRSPPTSAIALSGFLCQQQAIAQGERLNGGVETPGGRLATGEPRIHGPAEMEVETNHSRLGQSSSDSPRVVNGISMHDAGQSMRTKAGGYPHTLASRTKISAANKGKTPWNKGRARSSEERARISYGVLQRNRRRLEEKCVELGMTVEMYEQKKKEEERASSANIKARKTANGGYRPTEATKQKISQILKAKWANGEISMTEKRKRYLFRVGNKEQVRNRLGKAHSEETKEKIRKSLRAKWNEVSTVRSCCRR